MIAIILKYRAEIGILILAGLVCVWYHHNVTVPKRDLVTALEDNHKLSDQYDVCRANIEKQNKAVDNLHKDSTEDHKKRSAAAKKKLDQSNQTRAKQIGKDTGPAAMNSFFHDRLSP